MEGRVHQDWTGRCVAGGVRLAEVGGEILERARVEADERQDDLRHLGFGVALDLGGHA